MSLLTGKAKISDAFDALHNAGHFAQFIRRTIFKPKTIAHNPVNEFVGADVTPNPLGGFRLALNEFVAFVSRQQKISAVSRTRADTHKRHVVAQGFRSGQDNDVGGV